MKEKFSSTQLLGAGALILATMQYGLFGVISRYVGYSLPLFYQNWTRCLIAALILSVTYTQWIHIYRKDWIWILIRSLAGILGFIPFFIAVNVLPVSLTYFIFYSGVIIGGFAIGTFVFHEQLTTLRMCCLLLAITGLMFVYGVSTDISKPIFILYAFLAGLGFQIWSAVSKKIANYPAAQLTFLDNSIVVIIYLIISLVIGEQWQFSATLVQGASLLLGVFFASTGLLVIYGFRKIDVQIGSLILLSEIIFAVLYSYIFYKEIPSNTAVIGGLCIIAAMAIPEVHAYANRRKTIS